MGSRRKRRRRKLCWLSIKNALRLCCVGMQPMGTDSEGRRVHMIYSLKRPGNRTWLPCRGDSDYNTAEIVKRIRWVEEMT